MPWILIDFGPKEILDILLVALLAYSIILWMKRANAGLALVGILMLGGVYMAARQIGLELTAWILQGFFAVFLIVLVVLFHQDLRRLFERIAVWSLRRNSGAKAANETVLCLVEALGTLARHKHGALVVLPGRDPLDRHLEGGVDLGGRLSAPLLMSLFDPDSVGHDGALIVDDGRVTRFSVHLPLSQDFETLGQRGTRHSAALGLAERTDALCLVVSEERGEISIARDAKLHVLASSDELEGELEAFLEASRARRPQRRALWLLLTRNWVEKGMAAGLAFGLWVIFVSGGQGIQQTHMASVLVDNVPPTLEVTGVEPKEVEVTFSGPRREFYLLDQSQVEVRLDGSQAAGRKTFPIGADNVRHPEALTVVAVTPQAVELSVRRVKGGEEQGAPSK